MVIIKQLIVGILRRHLTYHPHPACRLSLAFIQVQRSTSISSSFITVAQLANYHHQAKLGVRNYSKMSAPAKNGTTPAAAPFQRLPDHVVPTNYALSFEPDWTNHTFKATALIDVLIKEPTDCVTLNASEFQVNQVTYSTASCEGPLVPDLFFLVKDQELLKINFPTVLSKGPGQLSIEYSGKVSDNLKGFFKSKYTGPNGEDRWHFLTKFEPTFARGCFPCWDEPAIKATYDITLIVPKDLVAVSNMPVKCDNPHPDNPTKKVVTFHRSVKMSTYVMAFAIGEFDYVEHLAPGVGGPSGILCRVYTPVGKKDRGSFALDVVVKSLQFYESYFGIPYPLPKMDLLGVTEFGSGAMENWGLVIFREQNLLMDEKQSSALTKQYVSIVVAHETAHMWFGNLVTMEWWSDLWLNEGFASWMEYLCVDNIYPELEIWNLFMSDFIHCLELDSSAISHPIQADVRDPAEIGAIFDTISYIKGASVIRMLHAYLGDSQFKEGLKRYLEGHLFGNAETKDLWGALKEKSGKEVGLIMGTWTEQMGYPLVTVLDVRNDKQDVVMRLKYEKFSWPGEDEKEDKAYRWIIPVTVRREGETRGGKCLSMVIDKDAGEEVEIRVEGVGEGEWVKLNADHVGYYRVAYREEKLMEKFEKAIKSKEMQPLDRLGILDDLFAGAKAGKGKTEDVLRFLEAYKNEDQYSVWSCVLSVLGDVGKLVRGSHLEEGFKKFASGILEPIYGKLGWDKKEDEKPQDSVLRTAILTRMVSLGHPLILEEAGMRFRRHLKGEVEISPDVRSAVYRAVIKGNPEEGLEQLLTVYRNTDLLEERVRILGALGAVGGGSGPAVDAVIEKILEFGRGKEVNKQDIITILVSLSEQGGVERGWQYFKQNWQFFRDNFPTGHFLIRRCVEGVAGGFKTEEKAVEVEQFFKEHQLKGVERSVNQALEKIRINKEWMERDAGGLQPFLEKYL